MQMDLEMVKVSRVKRNQETQQNQSADAWREEIIAMEQFLTSFVSQMESEFIGNNGFIKRRISCLKLPIHQAARFFTSMPKRFSGEYRETAA